MPKLEELIDTDAVFSRVTDYQLDRAEGRVFIRVHEILAGSKKGACLAYPSCIVGRAKDQYLVWAKTPDEAVERCLSEIKGVPLDDLKENP